MNNKGFTLIELLAAVIIIGVLAAIAFPKYFRTIEKSRASGAAAVLGSLARSEARFKMEKGYFTGNVSDLDILIKDSANNGANASGNTFEDKYYSFTVSDDVDNPTTAATRKNVSAADTYTLTVDYDDGSIVCTPSDNYICKYLGLN